jgi:hypothetical protein
MPHNLRPGLRVYTHAGVEIGSIAEVQGDFFKVNASRRPDFWVQAIDIIAETAAHDGVMLRRDARHSAAPERGE